MSHYPIHLEGHSIIWDSWLLTEPQQQVLLLLCNHDVSVFQQAAAGIGEKTAAGMLCELLQNEARFCAVPDLTPDAFADLVEIMFKFWTIGREVSDLCLLMATPD